MTFNETYCPAFISAKKPSVDHLWKLTQKEDLPFNKFIAPPVARCFQCEKDLTIRNNPSKAKLFTLDGPIPCTKVTLECRCCSYVYGVCNYSEKSGSHTCRKRNCVGVGSVSTAYIMQSFHKFIVSFT